MTRTGATAAAERVVHFVLPGDVDDPAVPSGGNTYDRRVCRDLPAAGWQVRPYAAPGSWPQPDATARTGLARHLAALPDGAVVLLDGLVACGVPEVLVPEAERLRLAVLVHLPLADETGLDPGRGGGAGRPRTPHPARRGERRRDQRLGRPPADRPSRAGGGAGPCRQTGSRRRASRTGHRRRHRAAVRRRGHPAQGAAPPGGGPRDRHRAALELRLRRRARP